MGYLAGSTGWRDALASKMHWQATLGHSAGYCSGGIILSTGKPLWRDTRAALAGYWDPLASRSIVWILGRVHWRAALAGYSAGSTGEQLWARSTGEQLWRDKASCSGRIGRGRGVEASQTRIPT